MPYDICDDDLTLDFLESEMARRGVTQVNLLSLLSVTHLHFAYNLDLESEDVGILANRGQKFSGPDFKTFNLRFKLPNKSLLSLIYSVLELNCFRMIKMEK